MGYQEKKQIVLDELEKSLGAVKEEEVEQFVDMICDAQQVFVVGVGRVLLMLQAFAKTFKPSWNQSKLCRSNR